MKKRVGECAVITTYKALGIAYHFLALNIGDAPDKDRGILLELKNDIYKAIQGYDKARDARRGATKGLVRRDENGERLF